MPTRQWDLALLDDRDVGGVVEPELEDQVDLAVGLGGLGGLSPLVCLALVLLDGQLARRFGSSSLGVVIDPVADKLFMASAFGVVAFSGRLEWYEILGILLRDIVAAIAFVATYVSHRLRSIPARAGGKAVTVLQVLTLLAFLAESSTLRPLAWATTAVALYAIWDYYHVAPVAERRVGGDDAR